MKQFLNGEQKLNAIVLKCIFLQTYDDSVISSTFSHTHNYPHHFWEIFRHMAKKNEKIINISHDENIIYMLCMYIV